MGMRIDKARQDHTTRKIEPFSSSRFPRTFDPSAGSYRDDSIVMYEKRAISNNSELGERATATRDAASKRQKLRAAGNQPVRHGESAWILSLLG
jgi:hypothetical protein